MKKTLNKSKIDNSMLLLGISQADLAAKLAVSRTAITSWLKSEKFPRPRHLLKLSETLKLSFEEIVTQIETEEPKVAFRKSGNHKITPDHIERFEFSAKLLQKLTPLLPFDSLSSVPKLKDPKNDYNYIQEVAASVRKNLDSKTTEIRFEDLIGLFRNFKSVLVPVLWGTKHYKNATHVYLPKSETTWIFINLDVGVFDFKFWLSHELGHAKAPHLTGEIGEDFADAFAGALLFPHSSAKDAYDAAINIKGEWKRFDKISKLAEELTISPITIYKQIEAYAKNSNLESLSLEKSVYSGTVVFSKKYELLSKSIFQSEEPSAAQLIKFSNENIGSCFFSVLSKFLLEHESPTKFISNLLDISIGDAVALNKELKIASIQDPR